MIIHVKKAHKYFFPHYFFSIFTPLKLSAEQDHLVHEKNIFIVKDQRDKNLSIMISDHLSIKHLLCSARTLSLSLQIQSFRCHSRQALSWGRIRITERSSRKLYVTFRTSWGFIPRRYGPAENRRVGPALLPMRQMFRRMSGCTGDGHRPKRRSQVFAAAIIGSR